MYIYIYIHIIIYIYTHHIHTCSHHETPTSRAHLPESMAHSQHGAAQKGSRPVAVLPELGHGKTWGKYGGYLIFGKIDMQLNSQWLIINRATQKKRCRKGWSFDDLFSIWFHIISISMVCIYIYIWCVYIYIIIYTYIYMVYINMYDIYIYIRIYVVYLSWISNSSAFFLAKDLWSPLPRKHRALRLGLQRWMPLLRAPVYNSNLPMVYDTRITSNNYSLGVYKPSYN